MKRKKPTPPNDPHVVLGPGGRLQCLHCGDSYQPALPAPVELLAAMATAFDKTHRLCPPPGKPRCSLCLNQGHTFHEHARLCYATPEQWLAGLDTGRAAKTLWRHMMGVPQVYAFGEHGPPRDPSDLGRCIRLLDLPWATGWRERIGEMAQYVGWDQLAPEWSVLEALYREETLAGSHAPKTYQRMNELLV